MYVHAITDVEYAQCMRHVLTAVQSSDLVALLENTRLTSERQAEHADSEAAGPSVILFYSDIITCM